MFYFVVSFIVILAILGIFIMTIYNKFQIMNVARASVR